MITEPKSWQHGSTTGYKAYGCRCWKCAMAMSAYQAQRRAAAPPERPSLTASVSWWTSAPRENFTQQVRADHLERMQSSRLGQGHGRPIGFSE